MEKLKGLGVQLGAANLPKSRSADVPELDHLLEGGELLTAAGATHAVERIYPPEHLHGDQPLLPPHIPAVMATWAKAPHLDGIDPTKVAFLDTETSGLSGGTGTLAFLVGVGRFEEQGFRLVQFFLRTPAEEVAMLSALESFLAPCQVLVSFNGKAFDVPLLRTRYRLNGWSRPPINELDQLDLLHLSRRLWRNTLPRCNLLSLETYILNVCRSAEDVPGWAIPELYFDYLQSGDASPLKNVFYHNAIDIISLVVLLNQAAALLDDSIHEARISGQEWVARGRLYEDQREPSKAAQAYTSAINKGLSEEIYWPTVKRLSLIHKRQGNLEAAIRLWRKAASRGELYAFVELAKVYEHRLGDIPAALEWTQAAIHLARSSFLTPIQRSRWLPELEHRLARLKRKSTSPG
jgi:hypothetical protein